MDTIKEAGPVITDAITDGLGKANTIMLEQLEEIFVRQRAADAANAASLNDAATRFNNGTSVTVNVVNSARLVA